MFVEQYGFCHRGSCPVNVFSFLDGVKGGVGRGERVEACYLDFLEALSSVYHVLLDRKVKVFLADANKKLVRMESGGESPRGESRGVHQI